MNDVPRTHPLGFNRNRRRNHALRAVLSAQHGNMINAIEQRNDRSHRIGISELAQSRFQLRSLHRNPEHIGGRHFSGDGNIHSEIAERTFKLSFLGYC